MKLILASKSPRRREILERLDIHPISILLDIDEEQGREGVQTPEELVMGLAERKVRAAWEKISREIDSSEWGNTVVLSADTIVYGNGEVLEKPKDEADAKRMLTALSGKCHFVYTGMAAVWDGQMTVDYRKTGVFFRELSEKEIDDYIATGEPIDKAGAYAVQQRGCLFVERIEGDFFNVMGLSAVGTDEMIKQAFGFGLNDCD